MDRIMFLLEILFSWFLLVFFIVIFIAPIIQYMALFFRLTLNGDSLTKKEMKQYLIPYYGIYRYIKSRWDKLE